MTTGQVWRPNQRLAVRLDISFEREVFCRMQNASPAYLTLTETAQIVDFLRRMFLVGFESGSIGPSFADPTFAGLRVAVSSVSRILAQQAVTVGKLLPSTTPQLEFVPLETPEITNLKSISEVAVFLQESIISRCHHVLDEICERSSFFQDANFVFFAQTCRVALTECEGLLNGVAKIGI